MNCFKHNIGNSLQYCPMCQAETVAALIASQRVEIGCINWVDELEAALRHVRTVRTQQLDKLGKCHPTYPYLIDLLEERVAAERSRSSTASISDRPL